MNTNNNLKQDFFYENVYCKPAEKKKATVWTNNNTYIGNISYCNTWVHIHPTIMLNNEKKTPTYRVFLSDFEELLSTTNFRTKTYLKVPLINSLDNKNITYNNLKNFVAIKERSEDLDIKLLFETFAILYNDPTKQETVNTRMKLILSYVEGSFNTRTANSYRTQNIYINEVDCKRVVKNMLKDLHCDRLDSYTKYIMLALNAIRPPEIEEEINNNNKEYEDNRSRHINNERKAEKQMKIEQIKNWKQLFIANVISEKKPF